MDDYEKSLLVIALASSILLGCGGGSGGSTDNHNPPTVTPTVNNKPIAVSSEQVSALTDQSIELDASQSHDPDSDAITYKWEVIGFPNEAKYNLSQDNVLKTQKINHSLGRS